MRQTIDSLKVGDLAYNVSSGGFSCYARKVVIAKITPKQIVGRDQQGLTTRYWLATGREVGPNTVNHLALKPPEWAKEPKHLIGRPDPKLPADA